MPRFIYFALVKDCTYYAIFPFRSSAYGYDVVLERLDLALTRGCCYVVCVALLCTHLF